MNLKKSALSLAVASAVGLGAMPAHALVTGVVSEALLVPLMMQDDTGEKHETYVQITVPLFLGRDLVIDTYLAPHVKAGDQLIIQGSQEPPPNFIIHWAAFDQESKNGISGFCSASPGDSVIWSSNGDFIEDVQDEQDEDLGQDGYSIWTGGVSGAGRPAGFIPTSKCGPGPSGLPSPSHDLGYVVFQTYQGAIGNDADFAMAGTAWIVDDYIEDVGGPDDVLLSVPVVPLVDGEDEGTTTELPSLRENEVINQQNNGGVNRPVNPVHVAPLAAGVRLNNGAAPANELIVVSGTVQGPFDGESGDYDQGHSMHVFWFPTLDNARYAAVNMWDEHEQSCDLNIPLPDEVNVYVYNAENWASPCNPNDPPGWDKVENCMDNHNNLDLLSVNALLKLKDYPLATVYKGQSIPEEYCESAFWDETFSGYAEYLIPEQNDTAGRLTEAGVFFEAQEDNDSLTSDEDGWMTHPMQALGAQ
jgi:hypothetical protein